MYHEVLNIVCFKTFSVKHKENDLHRKYTLFEGPAENLSSPTISQIEQKIVVMIVFHLQSLGAECHRQHFLNF